jgi:hypothetical protein
LLIEEDYIDDNIGNSSKASTCDLKCIKFEPDGQDLEEFMTSKELLRIYPNSKTICCCFQGFSFQKVCYDPRVGLNIFLLDEASSIDMRPLIPST